MGVKRTVKKAATNVLDSTEVDEKAIAWYSRIPKKTAVICLIIGFVLGIVASNL